MKVTLKILGILLCHIASHPISSAPKKIKDLKTFLALTTYCSKLKEKKQTPNRLNKGIQLIERYKNLFFYNAVLTDPFYLYPGEDILEESPLLKTLINKIKDFKEQISIYRIHKLNLPEDQCPADTIKEIFLLTQKLWNYSPITVQHQRKCLEYAACDFDKIAELIERGNRIQRNILKQHPIPKLLSGKMIPSPSISYYELAKIIIEEIEKLEDEKNIDLETAQTFLHGTHTWLIYLNGKIKKEEDSTREYLRKFGRSAAQEILLPAILEELITRLLEENCFNALELIMSGNSRIFKIKNKYNYSLGESLGKNKNQSAISALQHFVFTAPPLKKKHGIKNTAVTVQQLPELVV